MSRIRIGIAVLTLAALLPAAGALGQASTGSIYGKAVDEQGGALPGVSATATGIGAPLTTFTDTRGEFRFLNLSVGAYTVTLSLQGFSTVARDGVIVNLGQNTNLTIPMKLSAVTASVTVSGETPVIDTRKTSTGANYQLTELKSIPTGRDPWVILQQVPGVQMDRLNIAGSQSGQQSAYIGMGTDTTQNAFNMDGVTITDMAALGSSPTYYDFDQFQEIQVSTGGSDPSIAVPGVTLNMVTKRGSNEPHGSARYFYSPGELQANNAPQEAKQQADLGFFGPTVNSNNINKKVDRICTVGCQGGAAGIQDYGVEAGGSLWKDKAWLWGSYGRKEIPLTKLGGTTDTTYLDDYAGKLNLQPIDSNSATVFYFRGGKSKLGRSAGPTRPQETAVDQTGPTVIWKGQDSQVFSPNFIADASYDYTQSGFSLAPEGGLLDPTTNVYQDPNLVYHRSFSDSVFYRPQHQVSANSSLFFNTGAMGHEIKAGFGYRNAPISSSTFWPGNGILGKEKLVVRTGICPTGCAVADIFRPAIVSNEYKYYDGFIGDTMTVGNLTINAGLRYDYQYGNNTASGITANPAFPNLVPALNYNGSPVEFKWKTLQPRVGVNYALGAQKNTLLRASYSRYADQLGGSIVTWDNPAGGGGLGGSEYVWNDKNGNHTVDPGELGAFVKDLGGFNHNNPNALGSANSIDPNLKAPLTDEFQVSIEHQLMADFGVGLTGTYRKRTRLIWSPYSGISAADYSTIAATALPGYDYLGNKIGVTGNVYGTSLPASFTGGEFVTNRPDYNHEYFGLQLQATKRLTDKWMVHGSFAYNDWKQNIKNKATACIDPTNQRLYEDPAVSAGFPGPNVGPSCSDGQLYNQSLGSGNFGNVWINSHWSFNVSALYQLPMSFNVAGNFYGRQGYLNPAFVQVDTGNGEGTRPVLIGNPTDFRLKNVYELDLRLEKVVALFQKADITLTADLFNALNSNTILQRQGDATPSCDSNGKNCTGNFGAIQEIQNARAVRLGARVSF
jgi:Carboxypeptidase regulatory-like domain